MTAEIVPAEIIEENEDDVGIFFFGGALFEKPEAGFGESCGF